MAKAHNAISVTAARRCMVKLNCYKRNSVVVVCFLLVGDIGDCCDDDDAAMQAGGDQMKIQCLRSKVQ